MIVRLPPAKLPLEAKLPEVMAVVEKLKVPSVPVCVMPFSPVKLVRTEFFSCKVGCAFVPPITRFPPVF
jgi:hypothetical protein